MKIFLFGLPLFIISSSFGQTNMVMKNGKQYPATEPWEFVSNTYVFDSNPKIQIAKTENGGVLKVSVKVSNEKLYVGERVFINLKNNSLIYCIDKGNRIFLDGVASTYFLLNSKEVQLLKNQEIVDIRFKILGKQGAFDSQIGMFTASNVLTVYDIYSPDKKTIDTKTLIKNLFK